MGGTFIAKASARPITIQLVIIKPTNTDSSCAMSYAYAFKIWSTTITKLAIIFICTIIRTLDGTWMRIIEINKFENATTKVKAIHITKVLSKVEVTAKAEHTQRICNAIGLLAKIGPNSVCFTSFALAIIKSLLVHGV